jgi:hypothetical protein
MHLTPHKLRSLRQYSVLTTNWTTGVRSPAEAKDRSSILCVQTGSEAHPASNSMGTGGGVLSRELSTARA